MTIAPEPGEVAQIEHLAFEIGDATRCSVLQDLLDHRGDGSVIVFGRTKHGVNKLARRLQADGYPVAALQGNLSQNARDRVMDDFRTGAGAGAGGDERRRAWAGRQPRGAGDQRRAAGIAGAAHAPRRPHRPHGAAGAGDHAARPRGHDQVAAPGARVHPPHQTRPLAGREGGLLAQRQWQRQWRSHGQAPDVLEADRSRGRCAKRTSLRPDGPRRQRSAAAPRHAARRLAPRQERAPLRESSPRRERVAHDERRELERPRAACAAMVAIRAARTGSTPSAASRPLPRQETRSGTRRTTARVSAVISRSAPPAARPRRRPSAPIRARPVYCDGCYRDRRETRRATVASRRCNTQ